MKLLTLLSLLLTASTTTPITSTSDFVIGEPLTFESEVLQEVRTINVYLPLSYSEEDGRNYPVIYLLDSSADEDSAQETRAVRQLHNREPESLVGR